MLPSERFDAHLRSLMKCVTVQRHVARVLSACATLQQCLGGIPRDDGFRCSSALWP